MAEKSKTKNTTKGYLTLGLLLVIVILIFAITCDSNLKKQLTKKEIRTNYINKLLYNNGVNTVNVKLMLLIKKDLNDPNSYKLLELTHIDNDSIILVKTRFTAKNGFGGTLTKEVLVKIDTLGNITEILKWIK